MRLEATSTGILCAKKHTKIDPGCFKLRKPSGHFWDTWCFSDSRQSELPGPKFDPTAVSEMFYSRESGIVIFPAGVEPRRQKAANRTLYVAVTTTRITAYSKFIYSNFKRDTVFLIFCSLTPINFNILLFSKRDKLNANIRRKTIAVV